MADRDTQGDRVIVGIGSRGLTLGLRVVGFFQQRGILGSAYGSALPRRDIPRYVELYQKGELQLDPLVTRRIGLAEVNDAFEAMARGEGARSVIVFGE